MSSQIDKEKILNHKKAEYKTLQQKYELNNKKIKLLRKENEELKKHADKQNEADTMLLLQSKELSDANSKLEAAIEELQAKLNEPADAVMPEIVAIRDLTITPDVLEVDLSNKDLNDEQFSEIFPFVKIQSLILDCNALSDTSISEITTKFTSLKKLLLNSNKFTALAMSQISNLQSLKILQLNNDHLGDESLDYLSKCPTLTELSLSRNMITDKGAEKLEGLVKLVYLDVNSNELSDEGVKSILKLEKLVHLYIGWNQISYYGSRWCLKELKKLQVLDVRFNQFSAEEKDKLKGEKNEEIHLFA